MPFEDKKKNNFEKSIDDAVSKFDKNNEKHVEVLTKILHKIDNSNKKVNYRNEGSFTQNRLHDINDFSSGKLAPNLLKILMSSNPFTAAFEKAFKPSDKISNAIHKMFSNAIDRKYGNKQEDSTGSLPVSIDKIVSNIENMDRNISIIEKNTTDLNKYIIPIAKTILDRMNIQNKYIQKTEKLEENEVKLLTSINKDEKQKTEDNKKLKEVLGLLPVALVALLAYLNGKSKPVKEVIDNIKATTIDLPKNLDTIINGDKKIDKILTGKGYERLKGGGAWSVQNMSNDFPYALPGMNKIMDKISKEYFDKTGNILEVSGALGSSSSIHKGKQKNAGHYSGNKIDVVSKNLDGKKVEINESVMNNIMKKYPELFNKNETMGYEDRNTDNAHYDISVNKDALKQNTQSKNLINLQQSIDKNNINNGKNKNKQNTEKVSNKNNINVSRKLADNSKIEMHFGTSDDVLFSHAISSQPMMVM